MWPQNLTWQYWFYQTQQKNDSKLLSGGGLRLSIIVRVLKHNFSAKTYSIDLNQAGKRAGEQRVIITEPDLEVPAEFDSRTHTPSYHL